MKIVNLIGGGADIVCTGCIPEAKRDREGQIVSIANVDAPGETCAYCGGEAQAA